MASSSSSSIIEKKIFKHDVFLSFKGQETFVDTLCTALQEQGINTSKNNERFQEEKHLGEELIKTIEDSRFYIVVFSKNYASSSLCLDELVKIMECHKMAEQTAYIVFYDVEPLDVRKQIGAVGEAFTKHKEEENAEKWRGALEEAATNLPGWELNKTPWGHEAKIIQKIVEEISLGLPSIDSSIDEKLVGMDTRIDDLYSSLEIECDDVRMIGIWGMGGAGKTTLARALYDRLSIQFQAKSFVQTVREVSEPSIFGLKSLQNQILMDVLDDQDITVTNVSDGKDKLSKWLPGKKVLLVLDDVYHLDQLKALAGDFNWFEPGSRIIITTRNKTMLMAHHKAHFVYAISLLSPAEAACLFCRYAFGREIPIQGYEELSGKFIQYAGGHPLALRVLGSLLCGKNKIEWKDALERLKTITSMEILEMLKLSYNDLEDDYKKMFLDVACFLKGKRKDDAIRILESCGFNTKVGLRILEQKSLVSINISNNEEFIDMHDLIEEMGKHTVNHDHPRSRLWIHEEIEDILTNDLGTEATEAIVMEHCPQICNKAFANMKSLRLLSVISEIDDNIAVENYKVSPHFPDALQFLSWVGYPHQSLCETFQANNLVALEMPCSRIERLWEGGERKVLKNIRYVNLRSSQLKAIDLGLTPNLERLDLEDCYDLVELYTPSGCLKRLVYLNLSGCSRVDSLLFIKWLESLKVLCLNNLFLKEFPNIIPEHCNSNLQELRFRHNDIEELPSSIANLEELVCLDLHSCRNLRSLPRSICSLRHLKNFNLYGCSIEELPEDIDQLKSLVKLNLSFMPIKYLPESISMLKRLKALDLSSCWSLEMLPRDIGKLECLENLKVTDCKIKDIPDSICKLKRLQYISLLDCVKLEKLPSEVGLLENLEVLDLKGTRIRQLPHSISLLKGLRIYEPKLLHQSRNIASISETLEASTSIRKQITGHNKRTGAHVEAEDDLEKIQRPNKRIRI